MKTLYLECNAGAAGDMIMSALLELSPEPEKFIEKMNSLGIEGVEVTAEPAVKCGITGTHVHVYVNGKEEHSHDENEHHHEHHHEHDYHEHEHHHESEHHEHHEHEHEHHHHHTGMHEINHTIENLDIPDEVKADALAVYRIIAEAEAHAHNSTVDLIHFHEVGEKDAIADIVGVCLLIQEIAPERIIASPVRAGFGEVRCAHGVLPVPAPATEYILRGIPYYSGNARGEMCTPTGAAILKYFVSEFCEMPLMTVEKTGYGMGTKDFDHANCVRAMLGVTENEGDTMTELSFNVDDMTAEEIAFAAEALFEKGALDVFAVPVQMKKGRPGTLIACLCRNEDKDEMLSLIFKHTSTIGVRETLHKRHKLRRAVITEETEFGPVCFKRSSGFGVVRVKPEYEDIARIARENEMSVCEVKKKLEKR